MKLITAIIREYQLDQVRESLIQAGISRITVSRVSGNGNQVNTEVYRGKEFVPNLTPKMRIEIAVNDEFAEVTIDAIIKAAKSHNGHEGEVGDGKIFVTPLEQVIRIRTEERGSSAI
ncbi:P-II family nitrogen regulator [Saccharicrinis fermentans]|uniref:Nitrogen regulatory protein P-II n=1 Tax=Saccharicrinis fermentans DSM 9555 = JCM 21142 TaxID=869213 RepID=W7YHK9_9BACT|nr:P-II family nitrogen regulator [Saccharicrinis fermentans]GAF03941.1 nitrogen regulatory protein P-II [Saccharicrinis fermentans DSM 9555 = JCM 21142]